MVNVSRRVSPDQRLWWVGYLTVVTLGSILSLYARRRFDVPYVGVTLALLGALIAGWMIYPRATLYITLFLTAVSDRVTVWWFPFVKNLSSRESISFVADAVTISPLELALVTGVAISMLRQWARSHTLVEPSELTRPLVAFVVVVAYGFARGLMLGGDLRLAVLEGRALLYLPMVFVLVSNECTTPSHLRRCIWFVAGGVVAQSLLSLEYLERLDAAARQEIERLTEHGSALAQGLLVVALVCVMAFGQRSRGVSIALAVGAMPTIYVFFIAQRRAGIAALLLAAVIVATSMYWVRRPAFWKVVPITTVLFLVYLAAFWTSEGSLAFPARAVRSVVAPDLASARDQSSDLYRLVESYNLNFTIRTNPLTGLGFGQPFYQPISLPAITAFDLSAYTPHNSILWFWIKTGFVGFVTMLYVFTKSLVLGAQRIRGMAPGLDLAMSVTAVSFVGMFAVYSWVDISWDARNCVFLGMALAICARPTQAESLTVPDANAERQAQSPSIRTPSLSA